MSLTRSPGWAPVRAGAECRDCDGGITRHRCDVCKVLHLRAIGRGDLSAVARDVDDLLHYVTTLPDDLAVVGSPVRDVFDNLRRGLADALESLDVAGVRP